jgi:hypothetical protein
MKMETIKKLLSILESPFRKKAVALQFYLILGVLFESVGLGMVIPLVNVITDTNEAKNKPFVHFLQGLFGNMPNQQLVLVVLISFVFFYFLSLRRGYPGIFQPVFIKDTFFSPTLFSWIRTQRY